MAPPPVIDYVIVHELSHLVEMNHSRRFWGRLGLILPDYARRRKWLRENEHRLTL
jgi:predicted metal-dependent hydrolase